ncbi:CBU_0592 family membrane protein [Paracoccus ravus]|uniref:CBU_0592 family membrane protein n=1 Tax=Paracoccus ravus TaxID=2447760 RepID=UPI00106DD8C0|nr:cyclic nucleotide-binding protein [Paracoccus ravus]
MSLPDLVGLAGAAFYLGAYALLQTGKLSLGDWQYAALNILGAAALIGSLTWNWNLGAFISQTAWLLFTVIGFVRNYRAKYRANPVGMA